VLVGIGKALYSAERQSSRVLSRVMPEVERVEQVAGYSPDGLAPGSNQD